MDAAPAPVPLPLLAWDVLPDLFPGFPSPGRWLPLLQRHAALIDEARPRVRVTSVAPGDAVRRQYAESLEILRIATAGDSREPIVDIGSGGGFPGLVIAAIMPDAEIHLVEPLQKRARFLMELAAELGLGAVHVHAARAEDAGRGTLRDTGALVVARAVADLRVLLEYTAPFARPGGVLVLPKGSGVDAEVAAASAALAPLACGDGRVERMRPEVNPLAAVVLVEKAGTTPPAYPRRAGVPERRPL